MEGKTTFAQAMEALRTGKMATRSSWTTPGTFIFMQVPATISKTIVPNMQSLPQSVKNEFQRRFDEPDSQIDSISYSNQIGIVGPSNMIQGWMPEDNDSFAEDWVILD